MRALALAVCLGAAASPAAACRLALLLALDVSSSVDAGEDWLQRKGLAAALVDPEVQAAFLSGGPVALAAFEWSGKYQHDVLLGWRLIGSEADLAGAADTVQTSVRVEDAYPTALGYALGYAAGRLSEAPPCLTQTLDVSGDGENNDGFPPGAAYRHFPFEGVTVNALAIGGGAELLAYYETEVIRGPGAFAEYAVDYRDFGRAIKRKLLREVAPKAMAWAAE